MPAAKPYRRLSKLGNLQQTKAGTWRARYMRNGQWHSPGHVFATPELADGWLLDEQRLIESSRQAHSRVRWTPPATRRTEEERQKKRDTTTLDEYARAYIDQRRVRSGEPLAPKTRAEYLAYLDGILAPLAALPVIDVTPATVDRWWAEHDDTRRLRHHAYAFLRQVFAHAMTARGGELVQVNPCQVDNASYVANRTPDALRDARILSLTPAALDTLADAMPERWRALVLVLAYTALRPGEALALTRASIHRTERDGLPCWRLTVEAAVSTGTDDDGRTVRLVGKTKTAGSVRHVYLPPHLAPVLQAHLDQYAGPGAHGLLFPSTSDRARPATLQQVWGTSPSKRRTATGFHAARAAVGLPELTIYDLRRWGRMILRRAGMSDLDVEQYMGHALGRVTDAYALVDPGMVWAVMVRCSELAGWTKPAAPPTALPVPARLLDAMTPERLAEALAHMTDDQLEAVAAQVKPETLARALSVGTTTQEKQA